LLTIVLASAILAAGARADEPSAAGLVVQFPDGRVETRCVSFEEEEISGAELLSRSGLEYGIDPASGMGLIVCQIEGLGCNHPAEPCFCQCMGGGTCTYWNYFYKDPGQEGWTYSALGAAMHKVRAGAVDAWVWGDGHTPPTAGLDLAAICIVPAAEPSQVPEATPTASPQPTESPIAPTAPAATMTATSTTTPVASKPATSTAAPASPSPTFQDTVQQESAVMPAVPISSNQEGLPGYWPFLLMVLGLAAAGAVIWYRRR
jgi:hypothetical protein